MKNSLAGLYYPFSRCVLPTSLKQMLLVFDEITFVDPVSDDQWRAKLFADLESYDPGFVSHQGIDAALPELLRQGCIKRIDPGTTIDSRSRASDSAINDLSDPNWLRAASNPKKNGMPSIYFEGRPTWQIFKPKLPDQFITSLQTRPDFHKHLIREGDSRTSWSLSYAAGSAIGISLHLDIAGDQGLAPITDSSMHHHLMLMKWERAFSASNGTSPIPDDVSRGLSVNLASTLLSQVLPQEQLERASFEEIMRFREETNDLRRHFVNDIETRIGQLRSLPSAQEWLVVYRQVLSTIETELRNYEGEFTARRMKIWPNVLNATTTSAATGSLAAAVGVTLIPHPHALLFGGLAAVGIGTAVSYLNWRADRTKLEKSAPPTVAYLSRVSTQIV